MAIYHLNLRSVSRGDSGRGSAVNKLRYITRTGRYRGYDEQVNDIPNEVVHVDSGNIPAWCRQALDFWKAADKYERANARLAVEIEVALPRELSRGQQVDLVQGFIRELCDKQLPYTWALHRGKENNPHAHIVLSERRCDRFERSAETWFKRANKADPASGGAKKTAGIHGAKFTHVLRDAWARHTNQALKQAGLAARVDPRSYADRQIDVVPGRHRGPRICTPSRTLDPMENVLDVDFHNGTAPNYGHRLRDLYAEILELDKQAKREAAERLGRTLPVGTPSPDSALDPQKVAQARKSSQDRDGGRGGR